MAERHPGPAGSTHVCVKVPGGQPCGSGKGTAGVSGAQVGRSHFPEKQEKFEGEVNPVIEIIDNASEGVEKAIQKAVVIAASQAFRKYEMVNKELVIAKNASGNLRGMVINAKARVAYNIIGRAAETIEPVTKKITFVAWVLTFGEEVARSSGSVGKVIGSKAAPLQKANSLEDEALAIITRTLAKVGTGTVLGGGALALKTLGFVGGLEQYRMDPLYRGGQWLTGLHTKVDHWINEHDTGEKLGEYQQDVLSGAAKAGQKIGADKVGAQVRASASQIGRQTSDLAANVGKKLGQGVDEARQQIDRVVNCVVTFVHR